MIIPGEPLPCINKGQDPLFGNQSSIKEKVFPSFPVRGTITQPGIKIVKVKESLPEQGMGTVLLVIEFAYTYDSVKIITRLKKIIIQNKFNVIYSAVIEVLPVATLQNAVDP